MDYDGHEQRPLSGHQSISMAPAWSPPGDGLAYVSYFSGQPSIYWVELATGEKRPIVEDGLHNFTPDLLARRPVGRLHAVARRQHRDLQGQPPRRRAGAAHPQRPHRRQPGLEPERPRDRVHLGSRGLAADLRHGRRRRQRAPGVAGGPEQRRRELAPRRHPHRLRPPQRGRASASTSRSPTSRPRRPGSSPASRGRTRRPRSRPTGSTSCSSRRRDGSSQIWVIDVDGGNLRRLTSEGENFAPAWSGYPQSPRRPRKRCARRGRFALSARDTSCYTSPRQELRHRACL